MPFLPVAAREVREASRQARTYAWRAGTAAVALGVMTVLFWITQFNVGMAPGRVLFAGVSTAAFIYCLLAGAVRTADAISSEKRENTLGLLLLTDLKGWDILFGKLVSSAANSFLGLLAVMPLLAVPMLLGGVQWGEVGKMALSLMNALFYAISLGLLISTVVRQSVVAISLALMAMLFVGAATPVIAIYVQEEWRAKALSDAIFFLTPVHSHIYSFSTMATGGPGEHYWGSLATHHLLAWIYLRLAIYLLPRCWQDVPKNKSREQWRERLRGWRFGSGKSKNRLRTKLLNQSPLYWLANRERVSSMGLMIFAVVVLLTSFALGLSATAYRTGDMMVGWFVGLALVHAAIAFRMSMAVTQRLAEDRRSGALELLLGTEISVREILRGQWLAFGRQFFGPAMIAVFAGLFGLFLLLLAFSEDLRVGNILDTAVEMFARVFRKGANAEEAGALMIFLSIQLWLALSWIGLIWAGMWMGLREKRSGVAMWKALVLVYQPPWFVLVVSFATAGGSGILRGVPDGQIMAIGLVGGWILGLAHLAAICWWARRNLHARFREAAADRYMARAEFNWPRARRVALRFAAGAAVLYALFAGYRAYVDRRGEAVWKAALAGHPAFSFEPLLRMGNPVPDEENLANVRLVREAISTSQRRGNRPRVSWDLGGWGGEMGWKWSERRRTDLGAVAERYTSSKALKTALATPAETVLAGLSRYTNDFKELRANAAERPRTQLEPMVAGPAFFPGVAMAGPVWRNYFSDGREGLRSMGMALALQTSASLASRGRGETSLDDFFLAHRLAEGFADLPDSSQRYFEMLLDQAQPVYDGISAGKWTDAQLLQIQTFYEKLDLWKNCEAIRKNYLRLRVLEIETILNIRNGTAPYPSWWIMRQLPTGFLREREAKMLDWGARELTNIFNPQTRTIDMARLRQAEARAPYTGNRTSRGDPLLMLARLLGFTQTTVDQIIVACAIERFRNASGALPPSLAEISPTYLKKIPNDVFTGHPLAYLLAPEKTSYRIYSVGPDGANNVGYPQLIGHAWAFWNDQPGSDWVWDSSAQKEALHPSRRRP
jgi:ABC-type transport system involved in multi-copper enzyme maturation permease subunit